MPCTKENTFTDITANILLGTKARIYMYVPTPTEYLAFSHYMSFIRLISLFTVDLLSWHWSFIAYLPVP